MLASPVSGSPMPMPSPQTTDDPLAARPDSAQVRGASLSRGNMVGQAPRPTDAAARKRRGGALIKCALNSPFRECRGGEALRSTCQSYRAFDQNRYVDRPGIDGRPACEGWVREAMRRIDQSDSAAPMNLLSIVQQMRRDATGRRATVV